MRECFAVVFEDLQRPLEAGVPNPASLREWARRNPKDFYKIVAKLAEAEPKAAASGMTVNIYTGVPAPEAAPALPSALPALPVIEAELDFV